MKGTRTYERKEKHNTSTEKKDEQETDTSDE